MFKVGPDSTLAENQIGHLGDKLLLAQLRSLG